MLAHHHRQDRDHQNGQPTGKVSGPPLLTSSYFDPIFRDLRGSSVFFHGGLGWVGDDLIDWSVRRLFQAYGISETTIDRCDYVLESGGGNLGNGYPLAFQARQRLYAQATRFRKPVILLPKSLYGEPDVFPTCVAKVYARESQTASLVPQAVLAPDMALSFAGLAPRTEPTDEVGLFLRREEGRFAARNVPGDGGDPRRFLRNHAIELFELTSRYHTICTDRLHVAIAALILGRRVILLPDATFKNRAMFCTWLKDLGCEWSDKPIPVLSPRTTVAVPPTVSVDDLPYSIWHCGSSPASMTHVVCLLPDGRVGWHADKHKVTWSVIGRERLEFSDHRGDVSESFSLTSTTLTYLYGNAYPDNGQRYMRPSNITGSAALLAA